MKTAFGWSLILCMALGCGERAKPTAPGLPFADVTLNVHRTPGVRQREPFEVLAHKAFVRTGLTIRFTESEQADVILAQPAELPRFAEQLPAMVVPEAQRATGDVFPLYSKRLTSWNGDVRAVPLLGDGWLLAVRAGEPIPDTWEALVTRAETVRRATGKPSLGALPVDPLVVETLFYAIAACYDRVGVTQSPDEASGTLEDRENALFAFHFDLKTLQPRIDGPAFQHALALMKRLQACREPGTAIDPAEALREGRAAFELLPLDGLARLRGTRVDVGPLPGAEFTFDFENGRRLPLARPNRVPYLGAGGVVGIVKQGCPQAENAFAWLAGFRAPEGFGAEAIVAAKWGAGPMRSLHLEPRGRPLWLGYDLDPATTDALLDVLRGEFSSPILNDRNRLRIPNEAVLTSAVRAVLEATLRQGVDAPTLPMAAEIWRKQGEPSRRAVRASAGLE